MSLKDCKFNYDGKEVTIQDLVKLLPSVKYTTIYSACLRAFRTGSSTINGTIITYNISYILVNFTYADLHILSQSYYPQLVNPSTDLLKAKNISFVKEKKNVDYYLSPIGPLQPNYWKSIFSKVISFEQTFTEWCYCNNVPRSVIKWFREHSESFKSFMDSREYRHFVGQSSRSGTSFGKLINVKKTDMVRDHSSILNKSYKRMLSLCERYHVIPLFSRNEWYGSHYTGISKPPYYNVKCDLCGTVYSTYFHSSTIRVCPSCKEGSWKSHQESVIKSWLESKGYKVYQSYRFLIKSPKGHPMELDLYCPQLNLAIECNGFYWHSVNKHPKDYHVFKTEECLKQGVYLFHFWEDNSEAFIFNSLTSFIESNFNPKGKRFEISRDICPDYHLITDNNFYELSSYKETFWMYSPKATNKHKSNTICKDPSKYRELKKEGFIEIYNTGTYVFTSTKSDI